ncbi:MAG: mandelate racemase/muconate lactonizing enzyme family protein [Betaproteobacteria bacterium]|jgi:L-alanine-DL-glutamate epimerase-like enolase superfamily enzyme|nr:mandelate racemase/muconate lactonizing enzyme family protein [Betaproteobacteria bacterium]
MKITHASTALVSLPHDEPLADGPTTPGSKNFIVLKLGTDAGLEGIGFTFFGGSLDRALLAAVTDLAELCKGADPMRIEQITEKLRTSSPGGPGGILTLAMSAIDIALWDIKGKALNLPVATLAGGHRSTVNTYASGALMRHFSLDHVVKAAALLRSRGFRQMKTQLALPGDTNQVKEIERIRLIREAIGYETDLMCDINQRWDVRQAISIGRQVDPYRLFWLEDVTTCDDYDGLATVTRALDTPVACGEYLYGIAPFRQMLEARSVDIVMIDVLRAGGITQWLKIAGMAEAFNLPVVSHLAPEIHVHLVSAVPNGLTVEYMPWSSRLFKEVVQLKDGKLSVPQKPGLGLEFDPKVVQFK